MNREGGGPLSDTGVNPPNILQFIGALGRLCFNGMQIQMEVLSLLPMDFAMRYTWPFLFLPLCASVFIADKFWGAEIELD